MRTEAMKMDNLDEKKEKVKTVCASMCKHVALLTYLVGRSLSVFLIRPLDASSKHPTLTTLLLYNHKRHVNILQNRTPLIHLFTWLSRTYRMPTTADKREKAREVVDILEEISILLVCDSSMF